MISVPDAIKAIQEIILPLESVEMNIEDALNHVTCDSITSPIHMPPFNQSAMDGYALNGMNLASYEVVTEIQAGASAENIQLLSGQAARIFTGAMVPEGTTAIAKQEIVERSDNTIQLTAPVKENENIRPLGEQVEIGATALDKRTLINAGAAGFLYTLGLHSINVHRKPKVCIIATGNELVEPGQPLTPGKVYESNTYTLKTALKGLDIQADIKTVHDDLDSTRQSIQEAIEEYDLLITTGGISVGDYDFVGKAFEELGVETVFYKVKQKPGKPVFFGKSNESFVFGLPGNPAAVLSCFYMYVLPAIKTMMGSSNPFLETRKLALKGKYSKTKSLSHFLKARAFGNEVEIMGAQSSAMLSSFSTANCLIFMPEGQENWQCGDLVEAYMLPA